MDYQNFRVGGSSSSQFDTNDYYIPFLITIQEMDIFDPYSFSQPKNLDVAIQSMVKITSNQTQMSSVPTRMGNKRQISLV